MNELLAKIAANSKQIEAINAKQTAALTASEKDGVSAEDKKKHLDEFDRLQKEKEGLQAEAKALQERVNQLADTNAFLAQPLRAGVTFPPHNPNPPATDPARVPATFRRHGALVAYKGRERDAYAAGLWFAGAIASAHPSDFELSQHLKTRARGLNMGLDFATGPMATLGVATGNSNQGGGYFVPDVVETTIIELTLLYGVLRRLAEVVPMGSDTLTTPRWSTVMLAYWIGRGSKPTQSDPAWNAVQLIAKDLGAYTKIAKQLNEDSLVDLGEKVTVNIARAFTLAEDNAGFNGDGTSTYGGIKGLITLLADSANSNCLVTATGHTTVSALTNADFLQVAGKAPNYPDADWAWLCHKQVWAQSMAALQLAGGGNRVDEIAAGGRMSYLGYPVEFVNVMSAAPTSGNVAVLFADLKKAVKVGDRRGRTVQAGYENDDFTKQLVTILGTERVDVNCHTIVDPLGDTNAPGGPVMALKLG